MLNKKAIGAFVAAVTLLSGFAFASLPPVAFASSSSGNTSDGSGHADSDNIVFKNQYFKNLVISSLKDGTNPIIKDGAVNEITYAQARSVKSLKLSLYNYDNTDISDIENFSNLETLEFDGGKFSNESLSSIGKLTKLTKLTISHASIVDISSFESLKNLTNLQELTIGEYSKSTLVSDLSPLSSLTKLTKLHIATKSVTSLESIKGLTKLQTLYLQDGRGYCGISDISQLANLTDLKDLNIGVTEGVTSLEPLRGLTKLENVEVWGSIFSDLSPLAERDLKELHIRGYKGKSTSVLSKFKNLSELEIAFCDGIKDISFLKDFTKLKRLILFTLPVSDLKPLSGLTNLEDLDISTRASDLKPLSGLTKLRVLGVRGDFSDLSPLKNLTELRTLTLNSENLSDLKPIESLNKLDYIHIFAWNLKNIAPLSKLKALSWVTIACCKNIEDYSPLKDLSNLTHLSVNSSAQNDATITALKKSSLEIKFDECTYVCKPEHIPGTGGGSGDVPTSHGGTVNTSNSMPSAPKVPAAPKSVNDLKNEVKNKIVVGNNNVANAGVTNRVVVHVDNESFNNELKQKGSVRAYAFIYSTPKLLRGADGSDYVTVKAGANGVISFDAKFPDGYSGKHTVVLVDQEGNQLAWTNITVKNNVKKDATTKKDSKHSLPITGVNVVLTLFVMLMFATAGGLLRKVR